jgi:HAD superfamily hydrolase (TIGR01509 family)
MPGLLQLLSATAKLGLKLGVASSSSRAQVQTILTGMVDNDGDPLATHFASIVTGSDVQHKKPAPDIYVKACQQLGLAKEQCVAVEDSKTGIESARAAGIFTIAIPNRFTAHQDLSSANLVLNRLDEVLTMLG